MPYPTWENISFVVLISFYRSNPQVAVMSFLKGAALALAVFLPLTGALPADQPLSERAPGDGDWAAAYAKATTALAKISQQDKVNMVTGQGWQKGPCVGTTAAVSSIGYPQLCLQDGPLGVRYAQGVTAFPAGIQAASTWDTDLIYTRGNALGRLSSEQTSKEKILTRSDRC